jgi:DNA-binding CsgD family transcriptional regulator
MPKFGERIIDRLEVLIRLNSLLLTEGKKQTEQIRLLALGGIKPIEIADILNTTSNTVNVALSSLRRDGRVSGGRKTNAKR